MDASIFIPDISGYTEFISNTELEHGAHIINELLEVLAQSNRSDLKLAEIEGDALLFYRSGTPLAFDSMVHLAVTMFSNFHARLKLIERDSICPCGACQTASNLSLKFVVHYGAIQEIRISNFVKATGIDMVIAHRLLKNSLPSQEYVLATDKYLAAVATQTSSPAGFEPQLQWCDGAEDYPAVGSVAFRYALLDQVRLALPPAPERQPVVAELDQRSVQVEIAAPMHSVYRALIDFNSRPRWIEGLRGGEGEQPIDRLSARHFCYFDDFTIEVEPLEREIREDSIRYTEALTHVEKKFTGVAQFLFERGAANTTRLTGRVGARQGAALAQDAVQAMLAQMKGNLERLKVVCEQTVQ